MGYGVLHEYLKLLLRLLRALFPCEESRFEVHEHYLMH